MWIMDIVWPVVGLFGTVLALWGYFAFGRLSTANAIRDAKNAGRKPPNEMTPYPILVAKAATHCGSGCTLGDLCAEWLTFVFPAIAVWFGWHWLFAEKTFAVWIIDFLFAFAFGIAFQYFTIAPMRNLGVAQGLWAALKADALSLAAWQIGMYAFMAFANFYLFRRVLGATMQVDSAEFWFMMQIAMLCGFVTSYPVNWWLLRAGLKEKM
jgi:hypothetical protein